MKFIKNLKRMIHNYFESKSWNRKSAPKTSKSLFFFDEDGFLRFGFYDFIEKVFVEFNTENNKYYKVVAWKYTNAN